MKIFIFSRHEKTLASLMLQGFVVRLSENPKKNFIGRGRSGIIEEGDPNEVYQRIRQSSDDNGDMEHRGRSGGK
jgi:hypothetical protein